MGVTRRKHRAGLLVPVVVTLTACTGSSTPRSDGSATVTGLVRGYGGPAVLVHGKTKMALNGDPMSHQRVTATKSNKSVASTMTDASGRYVLHLSEGTYALAACGGPKKVTLRAGESKTVNLICSVP